MKKLLIYFKNYRLWTLILLILAYLQVTAALQLPDYMATIINQGILLNDQSIIFQTGLQMVLVALFSAICSIGVGYLGARIATGFTRDVREGIFIRIEGFSLNEFNKFSTASLITRSTNDVQQIQMVLIMIMRIFVVAPIIGVSAVIKAYKIAPSMSWVMALSVGILLSIIIVLFIIAVPRFRLLQKLVDRLNLITREILTGIRVIRAFNTQRYEEHKFDMVNSDLTRINLFVNRLMVFMQPIMMLIMNLTMIGIIWFGAHQIDLGNLQIGDLLAFMQYAIQVIMAFLMISIMFIIVPRASVSIQRIGEVLSTNSSVRDSAQPKVIDSTLKGRIEFKDVEFKYPHADVPVISGISFVAEPAQITAFIGSTGSGKSTLINLIPRFYDVTQGQILLDGVDIREIPQGELHSRIGYVPQKGVLFSGTVRSNIIYGKPDASDEQVILAAKIAQAQEFIEKQELTYDAPIAQGGTNFSGGQKQRIAIARAVVKAPEVYIFDDSFSALDFKTDAALRKALAEATRGATVLIVGQRVSTIMHADKIIVLNEGRIVGIGKHSELLQTCHVYKEICLSQLSEKEFTQYG